VNEPLNKILHQPVRTRLMAYLVAHTTCDYTALKKEFNLSDGHMTTHMRELIAHNYVTVEKVFFENKPRTTYHLTDEGKAAFSEYVNTLKSVILFK